MAKGKESFERRQRERAKKAKADAKRELRLNKPEASETDDEAEMPAVDQGAVLAELAQLHEAFDNENIALDEFEERRAALLSQIAVE